MLFFFCKLWYIKQAELMQVSPSGMASASQADFGGSDSRHLLQTKKRLGGAFLFGIYRIRESGGGKATLLPQVGGLHRRQNSGHPLFSVRVRSRRDSRHLLQTKKRLSGAPPLILAAAQFKHCAAALCRNNRRQHRIRPQKFHPADKTARFRASRF